MGRLAPPLAAFLSLAVAILPAGPAVLAQAPGTPAYLALGDSIGFGVGATNPSTLGYAGLTLEALRTSDRYRDRGLTLVNLSVPGATSSDLLLPNGQVVSAVSEIQKREEDASSLDDNVEIISLNIGGNDLLSLIAPDSPCFADAAADACIDKFGEVLSTLQGNIEASLKALRDAAPNARIVVLDLYNPYSGTGDPREIIADLGVGQVNGVVAAAAADPDLNVDTASVFQFFQGRGDQWIAADGLHPNDDGHIVVAEVLLAAIGGRAVAIPERLLLDPPGEVANAPDGQSSGNTESDDSNSLLLLAIVVPVTFAAGAVFSAAYFMARGRA